MYINKSLKQDKKIYQGFEPSQEFLDYGWQDLQSKMRELEQARAKRFFYFRPFVSLVLILFVLTGVLGGIVQASQKALPGEALYPVKRLSEDVASRVSGNPIYKVEGRAQEIVEISKSGRSSKEVEKAVEEYKAAVDEASRSGKNKVEIEESLEEHEREFEEIREGPSIKEIDEAIEISKSGRRGGENEDRSDSNSGSN